MRLSDAVQFEPQSSTFGKQNVEFHIPRLDVDWTTYGKYPWGGFLLAVIIKACVKFQKKTSKHNDPSWLSAQFLRVARIGRPLRVRIWVIKSSRLVSHLEATVLQDDAAIMKAMAIFCNFSEFTGPTLETDEPSMPSNPLEKYPFPLEKSSLPSKLFFGKHVNLLNVPSLQNSRNCGLEWGTWLEFSTEDVNTLDIEHLALLADLVRHGPDLLSRDGSESYWFPTLAVTIQFYQRMSKKTTAPQFGVYSNCSFLKNGRHENSVEIWTKPDGSDPESKSVCLLKASQQALTFSVNPAPKSSHL